jgi:hypothetical protein
MREERDFLTTFDVIRMFLREVKNPLGSGDLRPFEPQNEGAGHSLYRCHPPTQCSDPHVLAALFLQDFSNYGHKL